MDTAGDLCGLDVNRCLGGRGQQHRDESDARVVQRAAEGIGAVSAPVRHRLADPHLQVMRFLHSVDLTQGLPDDRRMQQVGTKHDGNAHLRHPADWRFDEHGPNRCASGDVIGNLVENVADCSRWDRNDERFALAAQFLKGAIGHVGNRSEFGGRTGSPPDADEVGSGMEHSVGMQRRPLAPADNPDARHHRIVA